MSEFEKYIPPLVEPEKNPKKWFGGFKDFFSTLYHGIIPHKNPKEAELKLYESNLVGIPDKELNTFYQIAVSMYDDSRDSIKSIEEKSFKLLTYISALSAILFFFLSKEINTLITILIIVSLTLLVIAMVISLRCVGLKNQQAIFIKTAFDFDNKIQPNRERHIIAELMNFAVFNRNVANNTADILKAARHFLSLGIVFTVFSLILFFTANNTYEKINKVSVSFDNQLIMEQHLRIIEKQSIELEKLNTLINNLNNIVTEKKDKIDSLISEIKSLHTTAVLHNGGVSGKLNGSASKKY
jgi:hypothetical protein